MCKVVYKHFVQKDLFFTMASLTIDQLKKSLTEQGIALPPHGSKKADYVKLYEQYSTLNENLGDFYSSDDENPPRNAGQSVTSSSSPSKIESVIKEVERLTDDELYSQLKELGASIGPVLKNTRKVYEKKLIKLLGGGGQTNGVDVTGSRKSNSTFRVEEFSDSEVDLPSIKTSYKTVLNKGSLKGSRSSLNQESPKPSVEEHVSEQSIDRRYSMQSYSERDRKSMLPGAFSSEIKSSRFSFIETIPKGSTYRYIEPNSEVDYPSSTIRSRFNAEKSNLGQDEYYSGTWEPNVKKYLGPQQQTKIAKRSASAVLPPKSSSFKENLIAVLIVVAFILLLLYLYFYQWSVADPYKEIEDDAERELKNLAAKSVD